MAAFTQSLDDLMTRIGARSTGGGLQDEVLGMGGIGRAEARQGGRTALAGHPVERVADAPGLQVGGDDVPLHGQPSSSTRVMLNRPDASRSR